MTRPLQLFVLAALLVIPFAVACARQSGSANMESEGQALLETDRAWAEAARKGDIPGLTSFWADDAINYFPGAPPLVGKQAISQLVNRNRSQPGFSLSWEPETAVVARSGELGYTSGSFELSVSDPAGNPVTKPGHYVCIWKKRADGSWKCSVETSVFSSSPDK